MREQITFETVRTQEQFDALKKHVSECDPVHRFDDHSLLPAVVMRRGDRRIGFLQVINHPIVMPSFHLSSCSARDFKDGCEAVRNIYQYGSMSERFQNGTCFLALPPNLIIDDQLVEKLGGERMQRELWQFTPKS